MKRKYLSCKIKFSLTNSVPFLNFPFLFHPFYSIHRVRVALAKRAQNNADHRALLYNYFNHAIGNQNLNSPKRNFDEIDRFSDFDKRFDDFDRSGSLYDFDKRIPVHSNFDEISRYGFNELKKRNFDEIDRQGFGSNF